MKEEFDQNKAVDYFFNKRSGILHLNWFIDAFWTKVTKEYIIPSLLAIYKKLVEKNITEENKIYWGDADGKMFYIPNEERKVMVFTTQNRDYLFILTPIKVRDYFPDAPSLEKKFGEEYDSHSIHVRRIWRIYNPKNDVFDLESKTTINDILGSVEEFEEYADDSSQYPQRLSLDFYKKANFDLDVYNTKFRLFGDFRDSGFILSYNDRFNGRLEGSQYSHVELSQLVKNNIPCMVYELELEFPLTLREL